MSQECLAVNAHGAAEWGWQDPQCQGKSEKEMGEGGDPLKDGKEGEEKVLKKVIIATVGLICPLNGPTMSWAKFFSLSKK